jgi:hypothetical protein
MQSQKLSAENSKVHHNSVIIQLLIYRFRYIVVFGTFWVHMPGNILLQTILTGWPPNASDETYLIICLANDLIVALQMV